jgi:hypothetical protein
MGFLNAAYNSDAGSSTSTVAKPTGTTTGDLLIAIVAADSDSTIANVTAPTGWTVSGSFAPYVRMKVWYKVAGSSEPTSYSFVHSNASGRAVILRFNNFDTANPINQISFFDGSSSPQSDSASETAPSLTPTVTGAVLVTAYATQGGTRSYTAPSGMTEISDNSDGWISFASFVQTLSSTAATGTKTAVSSEAAGYTSVSLLVNPSSGTAVSAPVVNAGADVSVTVNTAVSRTATESGGTPTSRQWTNVGTGAVLSTTASVSFTPTAVGTTTLRYTATNSGGTGTDDFIVTATAAASSSTLLPPTNLVATPVSTTQINLSWTAASGATGYDVEKDGTIVATAITTTTYSDTGLTPGSTHSYRVRTVG